MESWFESRLPSQLPLPVADDNAIRNQAMALKKCPFCQSIIDEKVQFCSACGTQLLFPEDESIEEDIPGDKIVDHDRERRKPS
jgi:hypothetical protein